MRGLPRLEAPQVDGQPTRWAQRRGARVRRTRLSRMGGAHEPGAGATRRRLRVGRRLRAARHPPNRSEDRTDPRSHPCGGRIPSRSRPAPARCGWPTRATTRSHASTHERTRATQAIAVGGGPVAVATGGGEVWVAGAKEDRSGALIRARTASAGRSQWDTGRRASRLPAGWCGSPCAHEAPAPRRPTAGTTAGPRERLETEHGLQLIRRLWRAGSTGPGRRLYRDA
jgi:hypothetical protein